MRLGEIADRLFCKLECDEALDIEGVATLENARQGELSFFTNIKYSQKAKTTRASALIVGQDSPSLGLPLLRSDNPYLAFAKAVELFYRPAPRRASIHPTAWISNTARVGKNVSVGAYTYIGEEVVIEDEAAIGANCTIADRAKIGEKTVVHSGCSIREDVIIGKRCIIQNNSVVGADGFGYAKQEDGAWYKIFQAGTVVIEDDAELGACTTIDRAALGETRIHSGVKIDNLAHIGHGSSVGSNSLICAQVGLSGSTTVGRQVILAGQVGAAGHLTIGDGAIATAQAGIPNSVDPGQIIAGSPAMDKRLWLKTSALIARLPELQKALRDLESRVRALETISKTEPEVLKEGV